MRASLIALSGAYAFGIGAAISLVTIPPLAATFGLVALCTAALAEYLDARGH